MAAPDVSTNAAQLPPLAPERPVVWPPRTVRTLANGMKVVLVELHTVPKLEGQLLIRSGNAAASQVACGLAEMTASVLRAGTHSRTEREIEEELRRIGANLNCSAGTDSSGISFDGLSEFSNDLLALAADLAMNASFPQAEFERERRQKIEELKIERTTPGFLAGEHMRRVLFSGHPYAQVAPTIEQAEAYTREQLVAFHREHFVPENALLILAGDFSTEKIFAQVEAAFARWPAARRKEPDFPALAPLRGRRVHLVHFPGAVQTQVLTANRAITRHHPDWFALTLANAIFGGAFHSRLVINIREQKGYSYSPRSNVTALRHHGFFSVHAAVRNDVTAATLAEMFYEMDRMRALPVSDEELRDAQNYLAGMFSLGLATQEGLAGQLATVYLNDLPEEYLERYRERIRALTKDHVLAAARKYFDSANAQMVVVGDREVVGEQAALFGDVEVCDVNGKRIE